MVNETEKENTLVDLGETGLIEIPQFDCKPYIGVKVNIEKIESHKGKHGFFIKLISSVVAKFNDKDITASKIFGLYEDKEGKIGWGEKTKLGVYLKKHKVKHYNELKGKEIILQTRTNDEGVEFLDFN